MAKMANLVKRLCIKQKNSLRSVFSMSIIIEDDPYQDIYDDVSAELEYKSFTQVELFRHCLKTCDRIFKVSEFQYGKKSTDIPPDFLEDIAFLYTIKRDCCSSEGMPTDKYDYPTSGKNFMKSASDFSIGDLEDTLIKNQNDANVEYFFLKSPMKDEVHKIYSKYLPLFFGMKYSNPTEITSGGIVLVDNNFEKNYELLRLIKILYDCKAECNLDLGYLLRMSFSKQMKQISSSYSKAVEFIKERLLVRSSDSGFRVHLQTVMELEKYNNSVRSFINSFSEGIVEHVLKYIPHPSCEAIRFVCENIYLKVIKNLEKIPPTIPKKIESANAIQCYAYEHFLMTDIYRANYLEFYSQIFKVEASEDFYNKLGQFLNSNEISQTKTVEQLVDNHKDKILEILYPKISNGTERKKFSVRMERHKEDYGILVRVYNLVMNRRESVCLNNFEMCVMIYLYEILSDKAIDIPLSSGYMADKKSRDLKITALVKQIKAKLNEEEISNPLSEEEFFLACLWLGEQMYTLMNCRTIKIQILREKMKSKLLEYWLASVPLLTESGYRVNLEDLIEKILPKQELQRIVDDATKL